MDSSQTTDTEIVYRLQGEVGGEVRRFVLSPGQNVLGSSRSGHVYLAVTGVSRRHAVLTVAGSHLFLEDLDSKNGTFVDGAAVRQRRPVEVGQHLRFGPVALQLEAIEADDAVLGMVVEDLPESHQPGTRVDETTWLTRDRESDGGDSLRVIEALLERLTVRPEPDLGGAASVLARALGADAAAFLEWSGSGQGVVLAASGPVRFLPAAKAVAEAPRDRRDRRLRWFESDAGETLYGPVRDAGPASEGRRFGLLLSGTLPASRSQPMMTTALRLMMAFRVEAVHELGGALGDGSSGDLGDQPADDLPSSIAELRMPAGIVRGESPVMVALYQQLATLVRGDLPVLISGETGVGKEHLAHTIHQSSDRHDGPFVAVNCAAIPADLLEAEMFGIGKGVATGVEARQGRFLEADGGTLFLDEIGEMPAPLQAKLLRALQEGQILPVGLSSQAVDVRVLSATNADLRARANEGAFRLDLYYRIAGFELVVPPLRERKEDLPRLVGHFLRRFGAEAGKPVRGVTVKALRALAAYSWPGNVRELAHEVRRLAYLCPRNQAVDYDMLGHHVLEGASGATTLEPPTAKLDDWESKGLDEHVGELERELIRLALVKTGGNQTRAAKLLRISRNGIAKRMKRLGMEMDQVVD